MEIIKGRRSVITASISQSDAAFDLTGFLAKIVISATVGSVPVLNKEGVISAPATGVIVFTILPADLQAAEASHYRLEVNIWKISDPTILYTPISAAVLLKSGLVASPAA